MEIKGFRVVEIVDKATQRSSVLIKDVADLSPYGFDLKGTFECGQSFRWHKSDLQHYSGIRSANLPYYSGIVSGRSVLISIQDDRHLLIENATAEDFDTLWYSYFDLSTDYAPVISKVGKDDFMKKVIQFSGGVRLLKQDFEETLFSYILSSQNNIPRIRKLVEILCELYGERIIDRPSRDVTGESAGCNCFSGYSFPTSEALAKLFCVKDRISCRSNDLCENPFGGYRCPYIKNTAHMLVAGNIEIDSSRLVLMTADDARKELCQYPGVGEKVADCVLLYSGIRKDICPIDIWVEKTIKSEYLGIDATKKDIRAFTQTYFGSYAGYAQLWFYNYARNQKIV